jgi:hypothetical protein
MYSEIKTSDTPL